MENKNGRDVSPSLKEGDGLNAWWLFPLVAVLAVAVFASEALIYAFDKKHPEVS